MYIDNNDLFFNKKDYIHFDNLFFTRNISNKRKTRYFNGCRIVAPRNDSLMINFELRPSIYNNDYAIQADIANRSSGYSIDSLFELPNTKNISHDKKNLLQIIRKVVNIMYSSLFLIRKYDIKVKLNCVKLCMSSDKINNMVYIPAMLGSLGTIITIFITNDNYNNVVIKYCSKIKESPKGKYEYNFILQADKMCIQNSYEETTYYFPNTSFPFYEKTIDIGRDITILDNCSHYKFNGGFITGNQYAVYISYLTTQSLLFNFFENTNVFKNIKEFHIENEYDLLKYL